MTQPGQTIAYVALGGNVGDVEATLRQALVRLGRMPGIRVLRISRMTWTDPAGGPAGQGRYLNGVAEIVTSLGPTELLHALQTVEADLGRNRSAEVRWGPRTCDLDLILMGEIVMETAELTLPHPRMHQRAFVLEGLVELAPDARHPGLGKTAGQLLRELREGRP